VTGDGADMDDNVQPKKRKSCDQVVKLLEVVHYQTFIQIKRSCFTLIGRVNAVIKAHRTDTQSFFGCGSSLMKNWMALLRQVLVAGFYPKTLRRIRYCKITEKD
jgi:ATP-dependent DNA helicase RecQ